MPLIAVEFRNTDACPVDLPGQMGRCALHSEFFSGSKSIFEPVFTSLRRGTKSLIQSPVSLLVI
jgi:hypothetical protein